MQKKFMSEKIAPTNCEGNKQTKNIFIDFIANPILPGTCPQNKPRDLPGLLILDPAPVGHLDKTI